MVKKIILAIIYIFISAGLSAKDGDTLKFNFYNKYDIQQWKGSWWYKKFDYIDPTKKYKKAILTVKLGCASYGCCVWDYSFHSYIIKPLSGNDTFRYGKMDTVTFNSVTVVLDSQAIYQKSTNYEVGRLITPYGTYMRANSNGFNNNTWEHPYVYDVTDYLPLLKDSFGIAIQSGGYDGKKGFKMTVELMLIEGSSNYTPSQVYQPYFKAYSYQNEPQIDSITKPFKFKLTNGETMAKFKTIVTGHGQEGEFSPIEYKVKLNGTQVFSKRLWKTDCDKTYIQPQGGTWIFSRCNWCPGEKVATFDIDLSNYLSKTDSNEIDIAFGAIENTATSQAANYDIMGHIITYTKKDSYDIALDEIIAPSKDPNYILNNPLCQGPVVRLKNNGIKTVREAFIDYWVHDGYKTTYVWKGTLKTEESIEVNLPPFPWTNMDYTSPKFYASLQKTKENMVTWNDTLLAPFNIPAVYNVSKLKFETKTTNDTKTNSFKLYDELGNVLIDKTYTNNNTTYSDTMTLEDGCYRLELIDYDDRLECGDGLNFWWSNQQMGKTTGSFRILNGMTNAVLKTFNPDFGGKINFQFTVNNKKIGEYTAKSDYHYQAYQFPDTAKNAVGSSPKIQWNIYPNPSVEDKFHVVFPTEWSGAVDMTMYSSDGKMVFTRKYKNKIPQDDISVSHLEAGTYYIELKNKNSVDTKPWVKY